MATPIPDEKWHILQNRNFFGCVLNIAGYHLGPVVPSEADRASLDAPIIFLNIFFQTESRFKTSNLIPVPKNVNN